MDQERLKSLKKFLIQQQSEEDREGRNRLMGAAAIGSVPLGIGAGIDIMKRSEVDKAESKMKRTRAWDDFLSKLKPGDIIQSRADIKKSPSAELFKLPMPMSQSHVMQLFKGDPYYHSAIYMGGGKTMGAEGRDWGVSIVDPEKEVPQAFKAYRAKDPESAKKAVEFMKKAKGTPYKSELDTLKHGFTHLFDPTGGPKTGKCDLSNPLGRFLCTEAVAEAYPKEISHRFAGPKDIAAAKNIDLVAKYNPIGNQSSLETFLTKYGYPVLKNAKWGLGAGALAYGLSSMVS